MPIFDDAGKRSANFYPLIVYVHVPKTAGTTIMKALDWWTPHGHNAVHTLMNDLASFQHLARKSDWIGGHAQRDWLAQNLIWLDRPIEYFSTVREPIAQLLSHLNFSFVKYFADNYHALYSRVEQELDSEVMSTDYSNPNAVINLLSQRSDYFMNIQARYLLGSDFAAISDEERNRRLATYTYIACETDLSKLYQAFGFAVTPKFVEHSRENSSKYYIDANIFKNPELKEFLAEHHRHDLHLYDVVRKIEWVSAKRNSFRPALLETTATSENFDEMFYLMSNPDVDDAVRARIFESGRAHFDKFGFGENRKLRRWVFPSSE